MAQCNSIVVLLLLFASSAKTDGACTQKGLKCDGNNVVYCKDAAGDGTVVLQCDADKEVCKEEDNIANCRSKSEDKIEVVCAGKSEVPDPSNCSQTYICEEGKEKPSMVCSCPKGQFVYPEKGLFCVDGDCPRLSISCHEGAFGFFKVGTTDNPISTSYCYNCVNSTAMNVFTDCAANNARYLPLDFTNGPSFYGVNNGKTCVPYLGRHEDPPEKPITSQTMQDSSQTTSENTQSPNATQGTTTAPTQAPDATPNCSKAGELHPTECDCDYYVCDQTLRPIRMRCAQGTYFHNTPKRCVFGECDPKKCKIH